MYKPTSVATTASFGWMFTFNLLLLSAIVFFWPQQNNPLSLPDLSEASSPFEPAFAPLPLWSTIIVKKGDNFGTLWHELSLARNQLQTILALPESRFLRKLRPGEIISVQVAQDQLKALSYPISDDKALLIEHQPENNGFASRIIARDLTLKPSFREVFLKDSLFQDGKKAGLSDKLILELAELFAWDIDFALDIQPGDSFRVLYEEKHIDGEKVGTGHILAALFKNQGKEYSAFRYTTSEGKTSYYTADGKSHRKAFLRTPVKFSHISSHFNLSRQHPVLHRIRAHKGVDYAAPSGTPVKATGEGRVVFAGRRGGYGNVIELQHGPQGQYTTVYAHLSGFSRGLQVGASIGQGQTIGFVGSTGLATGPHLHYEFRIQGIHHNPVTVALPHANPLSSGEKPRFLAAIQTLKTQMIAPPTAVLLARQP